VTLDHGVLEIYKAPLNLALSKNQKLQP